MAIEHEAAALESIIMVMRKHGVRSYKSDTCAIELEPLKASGPVTLTYVDENDVVGNQVPSSEEEKRKRYERLMFGSSS